MARNTTKTYIIIDANGKPAAGELKRLEDQAKETDGAIDDLGDPSKLDGLKGGIDGAIGQLGKMAGPAGIGAVVAGLGIAVQKTIDIAEETEQIEQLLELDAEAAGRLRAVFEDVGLEVEDVTAISLDTLEALEDNADMAKRLGINADEALTPMDAIRAAVDGWDLLTPTERIQTFGEEGSIQLSKLRAQGKDLDDLLAGIEDGRLIGDEAQAEALELKASIAEIKGLWDAIVITIGTEIIPLINDVKAIVDLIPTDNPLFSAIAQAAEAALNPLALAGDTLGYIVDTAEEAGIAVGVVGDAAEATETKIDGTKDATLIFGNMLEEARTKGVKAFGDVKTEYEKLIGKIDDEQAWIRLQQSFDDVYTSGLEAWAAAENGAADATEKAREHELELLDLQKEVGEYGKEILELPDEQVTDLIVNTPNLADTEQALADLTDPVTKTIYLQYRDLQANSPSRLPTFNQPGASSSTQNITVNFPKTATMRELDSSMAEWKRANG